MRSYTTTEAYCGANQPAGYQFNLGSATVTVCPLERKSNRTAPPPFVHPSGRDTSLYHAGASLLGDKPSPSTEQKAETKEDYERMTSRWTGLGNCLIKASAAGKTWAPGMLQIYSRWDSIMRDTIANKRPLDSARGFEDDIRAYQSNLGDGVSQDVDQYLDQCNYR